MNSPLKIVSVFAVVVLCQTGRISWAQDSGKTEPRLSAPTEQHGKVGSTNAGAGLPAGALLPARALQPPDLNKGVPLMQALKARKSTREFSEKTLTWRQLSELLWAADGVNRGSGERTAPSALARYPVDIYVVLPEGIYRYEPVEHQLRSIASGDFRKEAGTQEFARTAPVNLVYVADLDKSKDGTQDEKLAWAAIEAGCQVQNVNLYCASEGLGSVVRASIDKQKFARAAKLRPAQTILTAQTAGFPRN